jgi:hypothetical protein
MFSVQIFAHAGSLAHCCAMRSAHAGTRSGTLVVRASLARGSDIPGNGGGARRHQLLLVALGIQRFFRVNALQRSAGGRPRVKPGMVGNDRIELVDVGAAHAPAW